MSDRLTKLLAEAAGEQVDRLQVQDEEIATLTARIGVLEAALRLARQEMVASGNWLARDFGWPAARKAVEEALSASPPAPEEDPR